MKIGKYEINENARFLLLVEDELPISINAGNGIPMTAIWNNGEPKPFKLDGEFTVPLDAKDFEKLVNQE